MSSPTTVKLAVSSRRSLPSTPVPKRKVICLAEQSSPKEVLLLSTSSKTSTISDGEISLEPFSAPTQLFPGHVANVIHDYSHAHPSLEEEKGNVKAAWHQRHVLLPFNLRDLGINIYEGEVRDLLYQVFPKTVNVTETRQRAQLIFQTERLPEPPWPLTVGGLPFTISSFDNRGRAVIFPALNLGSLMVRICDEGHNVDSLSDKTLRELSSEVYSEIKKSLPDIHLVELMITSQRTIYIVLEDHVKILSIRHKLPGQIANCPVGYLNNRELHRPSWADLPAKRQVEPQPMGGVVDDTVYDILRPGVMISSKILKEHGHPASFSTTSGILVQNRHGDHFMTGASHGISDDGNIWQGSELRKHIGEAVLELSFTDISLVKLKDDIEFVNQTFENYSGEAPIFSRLATSEDRFAFDTCFLNSPFTGSMEASAVAKSVKFETSAHPTEDKLRYVVYNWCYMGQTEGNDERVRPPDGTCGSAIWDDNGVVTGFYHYYIDEGPWNGFAASVSASEVVEAGYTLVKE
ncbi:hypothetical protein F5B17DRAFT_385499 [Nemania serpens]|nr:hypothetical protein F5B17DRAFT_385499 [Nemania serpens]